MGDEASFWDHLDVLRGDLIRIAVAVLAAGTVAFALREPLFRLVLAPTHGDFFLWRWMNAAPYELRLVNTGLAEQMMIHLKVAAVAGLLAASPYILFVLFRFVSPALYADEKRHSTGIVIAAYAMFLVGIALNYILIFPLTVRFLGTYQVSAEVGNMLTIRSYVDTLLMMTIVFGVVCELPVVSAILGRLGLLRSEWMKRYRRHAIVVILTATAVITPTTDIFTLLIVSMPIWLLYEASILVVRGCEQPQ